MNVNHFHKALFYHVPKTGGSAIHLAMGRHERLKDKSPENIKKEYCDKRILITGGAGSIGSEIIRQLIKFNPSDTLISKFIF